MSVPLDPYDREILRYLHYCRNPPTTNQIAESLKISWNTAKSHLKKLRSMGFVFGRMRKKSVVWVLN